MRTIIAGSRGITDLAAVEQALRECGRWPTAVLSGTARGVDRLGEQWASLYGIPVERYPADWAQGLGAGHARNAVMAERAEALVALWDGASHGTRNMIETAKARGLRVHVHAACSSLCAPTEPCSVAASGQRDALPLPPPPPAPTDLPAGTQLVAGLGVATVLPDIDFETYSEAGFAWDEAARKWRALPNASQGKKGIFVVGAALYTAHPTCEVLCLAYDLKDGQGRRFWRPGLPLPFDLWAHIMGGGLLEAHSKGFEQWVWENVCVPRMGWPVVQPWQWRCSMAKARSFTLPGGLDAIGNVLNLPVQKDAEGSRLLDKFSIPRNPTQTDPRRRVRTLWTMGQVEEELARYVAALDPALKPQKREKMAEAWRKVLIADHIDTLALGRYNVTDIEAEAHVSAVVPDMTPQELLYWQDDQAINRRGVAIDVPALHACIAVIEQALERYNTELHAITGGAVDKASKLKELGNWLRAQGVPVGHGKGSMDDDAIEALLALPAVQGVARRALEIRAAVGSASVKKVFAMRNMLSAAGRLHDLYVWHGARTGRPTGSGPQPTNLPKAGPPTRACKACGHHHRPDALVCPWCAMPAPPGRPALEWSPAAAEDSLKVIASRSLATVENYFADAMAAVAGVLRGLFVAAAGHDFISSDFTAIEGVVVAALAGEQWRVQAYADDAPMYLVSAERMFGVTVAEMKAYAKEHGHHHPLRQKGKGGELGLGFGGWINALRQFGVDGTDEELKDTVLKWRAASPAIEWLWGGQSRGKAGGVARNAPGVRPDLEGADRWDKAPLFYGLEGAAIAATLQPGTEVMVDRLDGTPTGISYVVRGDVLFCRLLSGRAIPYHRPRLVQAAEEWRGLSLSFETNNTNPKNGPIGWIRMNTYGGRLAENCIAEGTPVLTSQGWIPIEAVHGGHMVHDGVEFVSHWGAVYQGEKPCIQLDGVAMTPDHKVLTDDGWCEAEKAAGRLHRPEVRHAAGGLPDRLSRAETHVDVLVRLRQVGGESAGRRDERRQAGPNSELRVCDSGVDRPRSTHARHEPAPGVCSVALDDRPLHAPDASGVGQLRRAWNHSLRRVARLVRGFLAGHGADLPAEPIARPERQQQGLLGGELRVADREGTEPQPAVQCLRRDAAGPHAVDASRRGVGPGEDHALLPRGERLACEQTVHARGRAQQRVWDILNCGPRHRFVVLGEGGPFVVHNCVQATARDIQMNAIHQLERAGYPIVLHTYDEVVAEVPLGFGSVEELERIMCTTPAWAAGWPIKAAGGWRAGRYRKG